jgi:hypothetical protein
MAERSVLATSRRRFSSLIKAALEGWLAMAGRSADIMPLSVSAVLIAPAAQVRRGVTPGQPLSRSVVMTAAAGCRRAISDRRPGASPRSSAREYIEFSVPHARTRAHGYENPP